MKKENQNVNYFSGSLLDSSSVVFGLLGEEGHSEICLLTLLFSVDDDGADVISVHCF